MDGNCASFSLCCVNINAHVQAAHTHTRAQSLFVLSTHAFVTAPLGEMENGSFAGGCHSPAAAMCSHSAARRKTTRRLNKPSRGFGSVSNFLIGVFFFQTDSIATM